MRSISFASCVVVAGLLAGCSPAIETVQSQTLAKTTQSWDGSKLPAYPAGQPEVTILRIQIPPHTELHLHKHPVINMGVLMRGRLTVVTDSGETLHLRAGDAIVEVVDKWHYGKNEGDSVAEIIVAYAGVQGEPITVLADETH